MHIKKYKKKIANVSICLLALTLFVTLTMGIIKDKKESENNTFISSEYDEELKPTSETNNTSTDKETKTDETLNEKTEVPNKDNEELNVVNTTSVASTTTKNTNKSTNKITNSTGGSNIDVITENPEEIIPVIENPTPATETTIPPVVDETPIPPVVEEPIIPPVVEETPPTTEIANTNTGLDANTPN